MAEIGCGVDRGRRPCGSGGWILLAAVCAAWGAGCAGGDTRSRLLVGVPDQQLLLFQDGAPVARYPVSTSKFGLGDRRGSCATPLGRLRVARKFGGGLPPGAVLKDRSFTGEVLPVDAPGRDPIVSRILWLRGLQSRNRNAFRRCIYIHGTPEERTLGQPASYGCIRMRSADVIDLYARVGVGAEVIISNRPLPRVEIPGPPAPEPAPDGGAPIGTQLSADGGPAIF